MRFGRAGLVTVVGVSVVLAVVTGLWLSTVSGMIYRSFGAVEVYSKSVSWVDSRRSFIVYGGSKVYYWCASNYWEIGLTLVNKGSGDVVIDGVFINGLPYYEVGCLTKYHIVYVVDGRFYVFPEKLLISPGGRVFLKILVPGSGFKVFEGHSSVFYSSGGYVFKHGDSLTISFTSGGSTLALVIILP